MNSKKTLSVIMMTLAWVSAAQALPAFPGAEGFGSDTIGGRGGKVYLVTSLEDYGKKATPIPGTLRYAVEQSGPRIVVFRTSGYIELKHPLVIANPNITIAGQTAPGDGVCLRDRQVVIRDTNDVIIRYLRVRPGDTMMGKDKSCDAFSIDNSRNVILDHCSATWSSDETISSTNESKNVTIQWCLIAECLHKPNGRETGHSKGSILSSGGPGISAHHNFYAHIVARMPKIGTNHWGEPGTVCDFRNNVLYDWGDGKAGYDAIEQPVRFNYVGNYLKAGTASSPKSVAFQVFGSKTSLYCDGNVFDGSDKMSSDNKLMFSLAKEAGSKVFLEKPVDVPAVTTLPAENARDTVLASVGAVVPARDAIDARIVESFKKGTGKIIDSQNEVGGYAPLKSGQAPKDSDSDGMPDDWELAHGLSPVDASDSWRDRNRDGYTNIEEYINSLAVKDIP
jgi:pectate lyase